MFVVSYEIKIAYAAARSTGLVVSTNARAALGARAVVGVYDDGGGLHVGCLFARAGLIEGELMYWNFGCCRNLLGDSEVGGVKWG